MTRRASERRRRRWRRNVPNWIYSHQWFGNKNIQNHWPVFRRIFPKNWIIMVQVYTRCTRIFGPSILVAPYSSIGWRGRGGSIHLQTNTHDYMSVRPVNTTHSVIILPHFSGLFPRVAEDKISAICSAQPTVNCAHYTFWIFPQPNAISVATSHTTSSSVSRHVTYETIKWRSVLTSSEMSRKQKLWQLETDADDENVLGKSGQWIG